MFAFIRWRLKPRMWLWFLHLDSIIYFLLSLLRELNSKWSYRHIKSRFLNYICNIWEFLIHCNVFKQINFLILIFNCTVFSFKFWLMMIVTLRCLVFNWVFIITFYVLFQSFQFPHQFIIILNSFHSNFFCITLLKGIFKLRMK